MLRTRLAIAGMMLTTLLALQEHRQEGRHGPERPAPTVEVVSAPVVACAEAAGAEAACAEAATRPPAPARRPSAASGRAAHRHDAAPARRYLFTGCGSE